MVRNHALAKSIADAAWTQFTHLLATKAAWAGRCFEVVNPAYTSQECSGCGWRNPALTLSDRVFHCLNPARPGCRLALDRDHNAARNILARGRGQRQEQHLQQVLSDLSDPRDQPAAPPALG